MTKMLIIVLLGNLEASVNERELLFQPAGGLLLAGLSVRVHLRGHQHEQAAGGVGDGDGDGSD